MPLNVGQTKRQLKTRIKGHSNNIKLNSFKHSIISEHILQFSHNFYRDNVKILDSELNFYKKLVSEMIHIKEQKMVSILRSILNLTNHILTYLIDFPNFKEQFLNILLYNVSQITFILMWHLDINTCYIWIILYSVSF